MSEPTTMPTGWDVSHYSDDLADPSPDDMCQCAHPLDAHRPEEEGCLACLALYGATHDLRECQCTAFTLAKPAPISLDPYERETPSTLDMPEGVPHTSQRRDEAAARFPRAGAESPFDSAVPLRAEAYPDEKDGVPGIAGQGAAAPDDGRTHFFGDGCQQPHADPDGAITLAELSGLMAMAATAQSRISEIEATADSEHERINEWLARETRNDRQLLTYVESAAEGFLRRRLKELDDLGDTNAKRSATTPYGEVTSLRLEPELVRDEAVLFAWAKENGYTRPIPADEVTDWARLKKAIKVTDDQKVLLGGKPVPGVVAEKRPAKVTVKVY